MRRFGAALMVAASVLLVAAGNLSAVHLDDVTGYWQESGKKDNYISVSQDNLIVSLAGKVSDLEVELVSEAPGEVVMKPKDPAVKGTIKLQPHGDDKLTLDFDGETSELVRLAPKGTGLSARLMGSWYLQLPGVPKSKSMVLEFTPDALITTEPGSKPDAEPLVVTAESRYALTAISGGEAVTFRLKGPAMTMTGAKEKKTYTFVR